MSLNAKMAAAMNVAENFQKINVAAKAAADALTVVRIQTGEQFLSSADYQTLRAAGDVLARVAEKSGAVEARAYVDAMAD